MKKLLSKLPHNLGQEMNGLWIDYEKGLTPETRFVEQVDKLINFFQGLEYWKKYGKIQYKFWIRRIKETLDDPILLEFLEVLEWEYFKKVKK